MASSTRLLARLRAAGVSLLLVTGLVTVPSGAGHAAALAIDVECLGSFTRAFSPPITTTVQPVTVIGTNTYNTCVIGSTGTGAELVQVQLSCVPVTTSPPVDETITWTDATGGSSVISWGSPVVAGQTVVYTGTVTSGRYLGDTATKVTSGISYIGSVAGCLLGTPIASTSGLIDSLLLTH